MLENINLIITCLSPIIVAYFGYISTKQQKQTKEFIDLQSKFNNLNEQNKKKEVEAQKKAIEGIQQSITELQTQMNELKSTVNIKGINDQLKDIIEISHINFEYSQSLSQVICAIGDCIDNSQVDKTSAAGFKKELDRHKSAEREFVNRIIKIAY